MFRLFASEDKERTSWSLQAASTTNEEPKELGIHKLNTSAISKQGRTLHVPESVQLRAYFTFSMQQETCLILLTEKPFPWSLPSLIYRKQLM